MKTSRRDLLRVGAATALGVATSRYVRVASAAEEGGRGGNLAVGTPPSVRRGDMLYRTLGRTGEEVSLVGLGGHHIGRPASEADGIRIVRSAIDRGITFMDKTRSCPSSSPIRSASSG